MNLIIDVGNTFTKLAVFKNNEIVSKVHFKTKNFISEFRALIKDFPEINSAIISSVGKLSNSKIEKVKKEFHVLELNTKTKLPFKNLYATPNTLGVDRLALVSASVKQYPNNNVLIIDAGTCVTYDFINDKNEYKGGAISPGLRLRYHSLHNLTANLPLLKKELPKDIIGNSTESSMHSGVVNGLIQEIDGVVKEYLIKTSDLTVILTGGDANFLSKRLKSSIFANSNFLLEGLNYILQYNQD